MDPIIMSVGGYALIAVAVAVKYLLKRKRSKEKKTITLIIGPGNGRNRILEFFRSQPKYDGYYFWHLEFNLKQTLEYKEVSAELQRMSEVDAVSYNIAMGMLIKELYLKNLKEIKKAGKQIVLVLSNPEYALLLDMKYKDIVIYQPSIKLSEQLMLNRQDTLLLKYIQGITDKLISKRFSNGDELLDLISDVLVQK